MQTLVLRWTFWSTLLIVIAVTTFGALRYLIPPEERTPLDRLHRSAKLVEQDEATVPHVAPEEIAFEAGFPVQWPIVLPGRAVLSHADVASGRRASFRWTDSDVGGDVPLLRLDQQLGPRPLPDRSDVTVRGLPGRFGPATCLELRIVSQMSSEHDCLGVWWVEDGVSIAVTSPMLAIDDLLEIAESLRPLDLTRPMVARTRSVVRIGPGRVSAGPAVEYPTPSVTYLPNLRVYLVRSVVGFTALIDEDPRLGDRTKWHVEMQRFHSPRHGETYTWLGRCLMGPCIRGLDRFAVSVERDVVVIDLATRFMQPTQPYWLRPDLYLAPTWP
jgi:hypothetical protein